MTPLEVSDLGTILGVWGHPDDEAYLSAGVMARAVEQGQRVVCVTATRGELGVLDPARWPAEDMGERRTREMEACMRTLGVTEHVWLDYPDGGCAAIDDDGAVARLLELFDEVRPDTLLTFTPDGGTGHPDHMAVSRWSRLACERAAAPPRLLYSTKTPEWNDAFFSQVDPAQVMMVEGMQPEAVPKDQLALYLKLEGADLERKVKAMLCMESQVAPLVEESGIESYAELISEEFFRDA